MRTILTITITLALALTGCIQNMDGLKDRLGATKEETLDPAVDTPATTTQPSAVATNVTPPKPPVARMSVFGPNGALLFKSSFAAEDPAETLMVEENSKLTVNAGDSETLERGAEIVRFAWTLNGAAVEGARTATIEVGEAGIYTIGLTVTDTKGSNDTQTLKLGVAPKPFEVVTELTTGAVAGAEGQGQSAEVVFDLAPAGETPALVQSVTFEALPGAACDAILTVLTPEGETVGTQDSEGFGGAETVTGGALAFGAYTIVVDPFACVEPEGVPLRITVVYVPVIEGLEADGHGDHAGH